MSINNNLRKMKNLPKPPFLCFVTNRNKTCGRPIAEIVKYAIDGGVNIIQIREKDLNDDELFEMVWKWLSDCEGRKKIASQGRERVLAGNHSHEDRIRYIFSQVLEGLENAGPC